MICNAVEEEDQDELIKLTMEYPEKDKYTPFLNMEAKIERDGQLNTRLYRKPQKKLLTLNYHSHHPTSIKEHTVLNMYNTAERVSSSTENKQYSEKMVDELLTNNGYKERVLQQIKDNKKKREFFRRKMMEPKNIHSKFHIFPTSARPGSSEQQKRTTFQSV